MVGLGAVGATHTGDGGDDFTATKTKRDVADLVSRYSRLQEDVEGEDRDLGGRRYGRDFQRPAFGWVEAGGWKLLKLTADMPDIWLQK